MTALPIYSLTAFGPLRSLRLPIYALAWLPALIGSITFVTRFEPIWMRFEEQGERLPLASNVLVTYSRYDNLSYHCLALLVIVGILLLDEAVLKFLRLFGARSAWPWVWFAFVLLGGVYTFGMILYALILPIIKLTSSVA